jgi:hypothetical protein
VGDGKRPGVERGPGVGSGSDSEAGDGNNGDSSACVSGVVDGDGEVGATITASVVIHGSGAVGEGTRTGPGAPAVESGVGATTGSLSSRSQPIAPAIRVAIVAISRRRVSGVEIPNSVRRTSMLSASKTSPDTSSSVRDVSSARM